MREPPTIERVDLAARPLDVLHHWPADEPLLLLHSGTARPPGALPSRGPRSRWARWSIIARPERWVAHAPDDADGPDRDGLDRLEAALAATRVAAPAVGADDGAALPFVGGWIGWLSYDLGAAIEPSARSPRAPRTDRSRAWPLYELAHCPTALVYDHRYDAWYAVGDFPWRRLERAAIVAGADRPAIGDWTSATAPDDHVDAVRRTLDYIAAGDVFQANIAQRLSAPFTGSVRQLAHGALEASEAWYGAHLELPGGRAIVSMSPELFLETEAAGGLVRTRPIKGTRPRDVDPAELRASAKDAAELHMIVDLMRNDLGRVRRFGSIAVPDARVIETHGAVHHGVGEVTGVLRDDVGPAALLRATMPPGSVTGAPKIRAMQIIDELEPVGRGPYCGAIGFVSDAGTARLSVAIRTMLVDPGGTIDYSVGGGIVADSEPMAEYRESLDKAAVLRTLFRRPFRRPAASAEDPRSDGSARPRNAGAPR